MHTAREACTTLIQKVVVVTVTFVVPSCSARVGLLMGVEGVQLLLVFQTSPCMAVVEMAARLKKTL
jgi:hypothetical protein